MSVLPFCADLFLSLLECPEGPNLWRVASPQGEFDNFRRREAPGATHVPAAKVDRDLRTIRC